MPTPPLEHPVDETLVFSKAPKSGAKFYMAGSDDRPTDNRIVAVAIRIRCDIKIGDRDFSSGSFCLHEIALMRRYYDARGGGSIRPQPGWLPALDQFARLTHDKLRAEIDRLRKGTVVPRPSQAPLVCFDDLFGTMPNEQITRMHTVMREQYDAWLKLVATCVGRMGARGHADPLIAKSMSLDLMTEREIDEIINIANPAMRGLSELELPAVPVPAAPVPLPILSDEEMEAAERAALAGAKASLDAAKLAAEGDKDPIADQLDRLKALGIPDRTAMELSSLLELAGAADTVADADISKITGFKDKAKVADVRKALIG